MTLQHNRSWFGPTGMTPEWQVVDTGVGQAVKREAGRKMQELTEHMTIDEMEALTASQRRILVTKAVGEAWKEVVKTYDFEKAFDSVGMTIGRHGRGVELRFEYMKKVQTADGGPPPPFQYNIGQVHGDGSDDEEEAGAPPAERGEDTVNAGAEGEPAVAIAGAEGQPAVVVVGPDGVTVDSGANHDEIGPQRIADDEADQVTEDSDIYSDGDDDDVDESDFALVPYPDKLA